MGERTYPAAALARFLGVAISAVERAARAAKTACAAASRAMGTRLGEAET